MEALLYTKNISFNCPAAHILPGNVTKPHETVRVSALKFRNLYDTSDFHDGADLDCGILGSEGNRQPGRLRHLWEANVKIEK
jgi:hypothetical protein